MARTPLVLAALLLAGCLGPGPGATWDVEAVDPAVPGLVLRARAAQDPGWDRVVGELRNEGPHEYWIWTGCQAPWTRTHLADATGERVHIHDEAVCLGHAHTRFPPGATQRFEDAWNGARYDPDTGAWTTAEAGRYAWIVVAWPLGTDEGLGESAGELRVRVEFQLGQS